eukprot:scaffold50535_cov72-Cyclotella_meneghiniana.AAC.2
MKYTFGMEGGATKGTRRGKSFRPWSRRRFMTSIVVWLQRVRKPDYDTRRTKAKGELRVNLTSVQLRPVAGGAGSQYQYYLAKYSDTLAPHFY